MGNLCALLKPQPAAPTNAKKQRLASSKRWSSSTSMRREKKQLDDNAIREQAIAAAILFKQHQQQQQKQHFDRSTSLRYPNGFSKNNNNNNNSNTLPRSSSSRARSLTDPLLQPHQLLNQVSLSLSCPLLFKTNQKVKSLSICSWVFIVL